MVARNIVARERLESGLNHDGDSVFLDIEDQKINWCRLRECNEKVKDLTMGYPFDALA